MLEIKAMICISGCRLILPSFVFRTKLYVQALKKYGQAEEHVVICPVQFICPASISAGLCFLS